MLRAPNNLRASIALLIAVSAPTRLVFAADAAESSPPDGSKASVAALQEIVVSARKQITVTKSDTPLMETPQNIQVLTGALLEDQGAVLLDDALRNVAGVMPGGYYNGYDYYRIRGFDASTSTFLDGLIFFNGVSQSTEIDGLEQVEVIKGPPSALYGQASLGGMVNLVSKHPTPEGFARFEATGGNHDFYDAQLDVDSSLNRSDTVYGRLNVIYRHTGSFVDFANGDRRVYVAPSVTWDIDPDTRLTFLLKYQNDLSELAPPLPADGTIRANPNGQIPLTRYLGDATNPGTVSQWRGHLGYELSHRFTDSLSFRQAFRLTLGNQQWDNLLYPVFLESDERTMLRYPYTLHDREQQISVDTGLQDKFETFGMRHTLIAGTDYRVYYENGGNRQIDYTNLSSFLPIDLFNPVYTPFTPAYVSDGSWRNRATDLGFYLQDQVKLLPALTLTAGVRYDTAVTGASGIDHRDYAFVPRAGLTYEVVPGVATYVSYSKSFTPQTGLDSATGDQVKPETGSQYELGVKTALMDGRLNTTTAIYQLTRQNVATPDPRNVNVYVVTGEQRSRGFEFDGQFKASRNVEMLLAYSYIDGKVTADNSIPVGDRLQNVPKNSVSGWLRYSFHDALLDGLAVSLGGSYYTRQAGDLPNTFDLPAYALLNGNLTYVHGHTRIQLNGRNLLGRTYYIGSYNDLYVLPGHPRTFQLTVSWPY